MEKSTVRLATAVPVLFAIWMVLPDMLHAQDTSIEGVWGNRSTSPDHPSWRIADQILAGNSELRIAYDHLTSLLSDPANDERSFSELIDEVLALRERHAQSLLIAPADPGRFPAANDDPYDDPRVQCEPVPFPLVLQAPYAFSIEFQGADVVIHHELQNTIRRVPLRQDRGSQPHPAAANAMAWLEDGVLIVETTGVEPFVLPPLRVVTTEELRILERYIPDPSDPDRLEYEVELNDPGTFRSPLVMFQPRVRIDGEAYLGEPCELMYEESRQ